MTQRTKRVKGWTVIYNFPSSKLYGNLDKKFGVYLAKRWALEEIRLKKMKRADGEELFRVIPITITYTLPRTKRTT